MSTPSATLPYIADRVMEQFGQDLDFLKEKYESYTHLSTLFKQGKRHYVEYLVALIASLEEYNKELNPLPPLQLLPPVHVDTIWHLHILETERYREFEENVLHVYRQNGRKTDLKHLNYSWVKNDENGRKVLIEWTKAFYKYNNLAFENPDETKMLGLKRTCNDGQGLSSSSKRLKTRRFHIQVRDQQSSKSLEIGRAHV